MRLTKDDAIALKDAWFSRGGQVLRQILAEQASLPKDELWEIMASKPELLTGGGAIKLAVRSKALTDFQESIEDELRPLNPTGQGK